MKTSNSNRQRQDIPNTGQKGNSYSGEKTSLSLCIYIYFYIKCENTGSRPSDRLETHGCAQNGDPRRTNDVRP